MSASRLFRSFTGNHTAVVCFRLLGNIESTVSQERYAGEAPRVFLLMRQQQPGYNNAAHFFSRNAR